MTTEQEQPKPPNELLDIVAANKDPESGEPEPMSPAEQRAEEEEKMAEILQVFAEIEGAIKHEMFNYLQTILGNSELVLMKKIEDEKLKKRLETVVTATRAIRRILDGFNIFNPQVRSLAGGYASRGPIDKDAIASEICQSLSFQISSHLDTLKEAITKELVADIPATWLDRNRIETILGAIEKLAAVAETYKNIKRYAVEEYVSARDDKTGKIKQVFVLDSQAASAPDVDKS